MWKVTNWTHEEETVEFETEIEARDFAVDTNGVLTHPDGKTESYSKGESEGVHPK